MTRNVWRVTDTATQSETHYTAHDLTITAGVLIFHDKHGNITTAIPPDQWAHVDLIDQETP